MAGDVPAGREELFLACGAILNIYTTQTQWSVSCLSEVPIECLYTEGWMDEAQKKF